MSLPDIDKVREHEARGGLWRYKANDRLPAFVILFVSTEGTLMLHRGCLPVVDASILEDSVHWTPCTPDGDTLTDS